MAELGGQHQQARPQFRPGRTVSHQDPANQLAGVPQGPDLWESRSRQRGRAPGLALTTYLGMSPWSESKSTEILIKALNLKRNM